MKSKHKKIAKGIALVVLVLVIAFGMNYIGKQSVCAKSDGVFKDGRCMELDYLGVCHLKSESFNGAAVFDNETMFVSNPANDSNILSS